MNTGIINIMRTNIRVTLRGEEAIVYGRSLWPILIMALFHILVIRCVEISDVHDTDYRVKSESPWMVVPATSVETIVKIKDDDAS